MPKYQATDLLDLYHRYGEVIFPPISFRKIYTLNGFLGARYSGDGIQTVAKQYFQNNLISSSVTKVGIVSNNIDPDSPYVFYSDDLNNDWYMSDVIRATAAAPTYLPAAAIRPFKKTPTGSEPDKELKYFVDGGISGMNNPSTRAYADISEMIYQEIDEELKIESDIKREIVTSYLCKDVRFISLGTGYVETHQSYSSMRNAGIINWLSALINLTLGMPSQSNDQQMKTFLPPFRNENSDMITRYWRLNPNIDKSLETMDNVSSENRAALESVAQFYVRENRDSIVQIAQILKARAYYKKKEEKFLSRKGTSKEKKDFPVCEHVYHKYVDILSGIDDNSEVLSSKRQSA